MRTPPFFLTTLCWAVISLAPLQGSSAQPIIIDHTCTDLTQIPAAWITQVKQQVQVHYAHTSHGGQITEGLDRLGQADNTALPIIPTIV